MVEEMVEIVVMTAANADLAAVNQTADARIVELTAIVKMLERALYGMRSERLRSDTPTDEQIAFVFDEIATGMAAIEAELAKAGGQDKPKRAAAAQGIQRTSGAGGDRRRPRGVPWLRGVGEGPDRRGRVVAPGRDAGQGPPDCDAPPERRVSQPRWRCSGASAAVSD